MPELAAYLAASAKAWTALEVGDNTAAARLAAQMACWPHESASATPEAGPSGEGREQNLAVGMCIVGDIHAIFFCYPRHWWCTVWGTAHGLLFNYIDLLQVRRVCCWRWRMGQVASALAARQRSRCRAGGPAQQGMAWRCRRRTCCWLRACVLPGAPLKAPSRDAQSVIKLLLRQMVDNVAG